MRSRASKPILLAAFIVLTCLGDIMAQDMNYWTLKYGTRNDLLGGAVVGSFLDLGVTFYNPGALTMSESNEALLSGQAFSLRSIRVESNLPVEQEFSSTTFGTAPTLFAGLFPSKWLPGQLAYSALTRQQFKARLASRTVAGPLLDGPNGTERYSAEKLFDQDMNENWFGATWANEIRDHVGIGLTWYAVYRGQRTRVEGSASRLDTLGSGQTLIAIDEFDYQHYRFVWKIGLALDYSPLTLGITLTTPSVALFGSGSAYFNRSANGLDLDGGEIPDALLVADNQKGLKSHYKTPLSVAAGASYRWEKIAAHASAEWFNGADKFDVLDAADLPSGFPGESLTHRVTQEFASVFNVGAGVEYTFAENISGFASFVTDKTAAVRGSDSKNSATNWDIYHITTGAAFVIYGLDLTLGFEYGFGSEKTQPSFKFIENLIGYAPDSKTVYRQLKAIVGFSFTL